MHVEPDGVFPEDENIHDSCKQHLAGLGKKNMS